MSKLQNERTNQKNLETSPETDVSDRLISDGESCHVYATVAPSIVSLFEKEFGLKCLLQARLLL